MNDTFREAHPDYSVRAAFMALRTGVGPAFKPFPDSGHSLLGRDPELAQCTKDGSTALAFDRRIVAQAIRIHHGRGAADTAGKFLHDFPWLVP